MVLSSSESEPESFLESEEKLLVGVVSRDSFLESSLLLRPLTLSLSLDIHFEKRGLAVGCLDSPRRRTRLVSGLLIMALEVRAVVVGFVGLAALFVALVFGF